MDKLKRWGVPLLAIAALLGWRFYQKSGDASEVHDGGLEAVLSWAHEGATEAQLRPLFEACHESAFEDAYRMGGRRRGASFDSDAYYANLFGCMEQRARAAGDGALADAVKGIHVDMLAQAASECRWATGRADAGRTGWVVSSGT